MALGAVARPLLARDDGGVIDLEPHHRQLAEEGYTIVENLISNDLVEELLADVARLEAKLNRSPDNNRFEGNRTTRTYNLLAHGDIWQQVPAQPQVLALIEGVLGKQCLVSSLASISLAPGETAQVIHADDQIHPIAKPHVATVCNSMWALTDFTEANGATRLVPGSHLLDSPDYHEDPTTIETIPAEMPKGSVLVWHGSTWHGGGANTTADEVRIGVAMNYCAGFIRQQENQQLGIPPEVMATFSPELRALCGLDMYRGLTGNIEKQSPAYLLYGDPHQTPLWDIDPIEAQS
jgi:ectoine hydroxylase-related dioxygenase (phytanoyl-CoA dioxygenase family)